MSYGVFEGVFWGVFSHCEASGSQSFLFSCIFHSADAIMIARALGGAFYTQLPRLSQLRISADSLLNYNPLLTRVQPTSRCGLANPD